MSTILAAIDTAAARPVVETAVRIGQMTGADVEAVHVRVSPSEPVGPLESLAARFGVPFRLLEDSAASALLTAVGDPGVIAAVIGARGISDGHRAIGETARRILELADKPIVVVPPEAVSPGPIRRLLVPLEGTTASSRPVLERLWPLLVAEIELVVLHVFTEATMPAMLDRPEYDLDILGGEFLTRHLPHAEHIEFRTGSISTRVAEVSREREADLIVLSWSQNPAPGRARVIREVLVGSALPVLVLPIDAFEDGPGEAPAPGGKAGP